MLDPSDPIFDAEINNEIRQKYIKMIADDLMKIVPAEQLDGFVTYRDSLEHFESLVKKRLGGDYRYDCWYDAMVDLRLNLRRLNQPDRKTKKDQSQYVIIRRARELETQHADDRDNEEQFVFWTGRRWSREYPEAKIYRTLEKAGAAHDDMERIGDIVGDYGTDTEFAVRYQGQDREDY